jgi:hypothetical protein
LILLKHTILLMKSQLVTSYTRISCEKSRFYAKKIIFFPILGGHVPGAPLPGSAPGSVVLRKIVIFHTKYPKDFRASLRSAQFFLIAPPLTWNPESTPVILKKLRRAEGGAKIFGVFRVKGITSY